MIKTILKTIALLLLAASFGLAAAKDDDKGGKDGKDGKGKTGSSSASQSVGPAPAGAPTDVANQAAAYFKLTNGKVLAAARDSGDGSVSFIWETKGVGLGGQPTAQSVYIVMKIFTVNGTLNQTVGECRKAASAQVCQSIGM